MNLPSPHHTWTYSQSRTPILYRSFLRPAILNIPVLHIPIRHLPIPPLPSVTPQRLLIQTLPPRPIPGIKTRPLPQPLTIRRRSMIHDTRSDHPKSQHHLDSPIDAQPANHDSPQSTARTNPATSCFRRALGRRCSSSAGRRRKRTSSP